MRVRTFLLVLAVTQATACNESFHFTSAQKALILDAAIVVRSDAAVVLDTPIIPPPDAAAPDVVVVPDAQLPLPPDVAEPEPDVPAVPDAQLPLPPDVAEPEPDVPAVPDTERPLPPDAAAPAPDVAAFLDMEPAIPPDTAALPPDVAAIPDAQLPPPPDALIADAMSDTRAPADLRTPDASTVCGVTASCPCTGSDCTCASHQRCDFSGVGCEKTSGACSLACNDGNDCNGQCQNNCDLSCTGASNCSLTMGPSATAKCQGAGVICVLTVGAGSTVQCNDHTSCNVTCTGSCKLTCDATGSGSVCKLRCPGESAFVSGGGSCPRPPIDE
jgi:hypothetical protein